MVFYRGKSGFRRKARNVARTTKRGFVKRYYNKNKRTGRKSLNIARVAQDVMKIKKSLNTETHTIKLLTHAPVEAQETSMTHANYKKAILKCCPTVQNPLHYTFPAISIGDSAWQRHGHSLKYNYLTIKGKISIIGALPNGHHCHGSKFTFMLVALKDGQAFDSPLQDSSVEENSFGRYFRSFLDHEALGSNDEVDYPATYLTCRKTQVASNMKVLMRRNVYHSGNAEDDVGTAIKDKLFQFKVPLNVIQKYWRNDISSMDPYNPSDPWMSSSVHQGNQNFIGPSYYGSNAGIINSPQNEQFNIATAQGTNNTTDIRTNSLHLLVFSDHKPRDTSKLVEDGKTFTNVNAGPLYRVSSVSYLNYVDN